MRRQKICHVKSLFRNLLMARKGFCGGGKEGTARQQTQGFMLSKLFLPGVSLLFSSPQCTRSLDLLLLISFLSDTYITFLQIHPYVSHCLKLKLTKGYNKGHQMFWVSRSFSSRQGLSRIQNSKEKLGKHKRIREHKKIEFCPR